ncbi:MAG: VOC family protein [Finegoldia sp.]|nr:VOC family protein [Finegoldia sp.]
MNYKSLHTCIRVKDLQESINFYQEALNMKITSKKDFPEKKFSLVYMTADDNQEIELTYNYGDNEYSHGDYYGHMAFGVDDLEASRKRHEELGIKVYEIKQLDDETRYYFIEDPDGFKIEIIDLSL